MMAAAVNSERDPMLESPAVSKGMPQVASCQGCRLACESCCCLFIIIFMVAVSLCMSKALPAVQTAVLIDKYLGGNPIFTVRTMPVQRDPALMQALKARLHAEADLVVGSEDADAHNHTWATGSPLKVMNILYNATRVPGVFEQVPKQLRGVFWFKGNGMPEELVSLQYGRWFPEERIYVMPFAPLMWSWTVGRPDKAPGHGVAYIPAIAKYASDLLASNDLIETWKFNADLTTSDLQAISYANMSHYEPQSLGFMNLPQITGENTMDDISLPGQEPGTLWHRGIKWGPGGCRCVDFGSYQLTKVLDADGAPLEPYHSEFLEYMGAHELYVWTGYVSGAEPRGPNDRESVP